jgi:uncharacterized protein YggE
MNTQTIQVQGKGNVSQAPDRLHIVFTISHTRKEFSESVEGCNERTEAVRRAISEVGRDEFELKTTNFNIREQTDYVKGRNVHLGFMATHQTTLELPIDKPLIGRLLSAVICGEAKPSVQLIFTVSDPESLKQRVLADAVGNAKRRAETIVQAAQLRLGKIERVDYGYSEIRVSSGPYDMDFASPEVKFAQMAPDINPRDIESEDTVKITWSLEA